MDLPVVFVSMYEHNSNLLPWRESGARVVVIPNTKNADFDYEVLEKELQAHASEKCLKIGAFSAGSNLTGTLNDTDRMAILCHTYGCLAFFDYAGVAPYVGINMNGPNELRRFAFDPTEKSALAYKDAVFISPHKFLGGPGSSGVLICKKTLLYVYDPKPARPGGGTVVYVNEDNTDYAENIEEIEESGTPGVIQDIRAGLVFQLKE